MNLPVFQNSIEGNHVAGPVIDLVYCAEHSGVEGRELTAAKEKRAKIGKKKPPKWDSNFVEDILG